MVIKDKRLTVSELAAKYKVSRMTIYRWIGQGMPYTEVGPANRKRFDAEAVEQWFSSGASERKR